MPLSNSCTFPVKGTLVLALFVCASAGAQTDAAQSLERQSDEAFRQVLAQPQNLDLWSTYARLLVKQGNYEGGIAALERLLLEPDASPSLRVEIGVLYYRLASYAKAQAVLRSALDDKRLPDDQRNLAVALIAEAGKRLQTSQLSGAVTFGLRQQSNAMFRTDSSQVIVGGVPVPFTQKPESNTDASLGLRVRHLYDLEKQNSASIVTNFGAYLVNFSSSAGSQVVANPTKPYDLLALDLSTGLQFKPLPSDLPDVTLRPHVLWSNVMAQGKQYLGNQGLGLDASWQLSERTLIDFTLDSQNRKFANRIDVPAADLLNGRLTSLRARVVQELATGHTLTGDYVLRRNRTGMDFYNYDANEIRVTYAFSYASPFASAGKSGGNWTTSVYAGALNRSYGAPDPAVSALDKRRDNESRLGINHVVPFTSQWALLLNVEQSRNRANFANFNYKNTSLSGTVLRSF
jgi:hypothetical protein